MMPLDAIVQILPVNVANLDTWIAMLVKLCQNLAVAMDLVNCFTQKNPCGFGVLGCLVSVA